MASIVRAEELPDGRWALVAIGGRRIRVVEWLADDPYPRAEVVDVAERPFPAGAEHLLADAEKVVRRSLALRAELDEPAPPDGGRPHPGPGGRRRGSWPRCRPSGRSTGSASWPSTTPPSGSSSSPP